MRKIDYTLGTFMFNGQSSQDFGICIESAPSFNKPMRKHNVYTIPGRNGDIIEQLDAFENVERTYEVWAANDAYTDAAQDFDAIGAWLYNSNGYCRLEDDFEPTVYRLAYFVGPMEIENLLNMYGRATIRFNCRPEKFLKTGDNPLSMNFSGGSTPASNIILNPTKYIAKPFIKITPNSSSGGSVQLMCNGKSLKISNLDAVTYVDCETMNVYTDTASKNSDATGDFPDMPAGENNFRILYGTRRPESIELTPRWYNI